jgi:Cdc6-like AAA superfamily ATPase
VTFASYSAHELVQILEARVGRSVFAAGALDYIAKKVAACSGDARKALEMASNAVQNCLRTTCESDCADGPLVKVPHVVQSNKDETANLKDRIEGLPLAGKVMICVLTSYARAGVVECTVGDLKDCVCDCLRQSGSEDEMLTMDDFVVVLETIVDSGLLLAATQNQSGGEFRLSGRELSEVHKQQIRLGLQLEEVEKALAIELKQSFYQTLRASAKEQRKRCAA